MEHVFFYVFVGMKLRKIRKHDKRCFESKWKNLTYSVHVIIIISFFYITLPEEFQQNAQ
jgi:hypothetical protein